MWVGVSLLGLTLLLIWSGLRAESGSKWSSHTLEVLQAGHQLETALGRTRAEHSGAPIIPALRFMRSLTADNAAQTRRVDGMLAIAQHPAAVNGLSEPQLSALDALYRELHDEEQALLARRRREEASADSNFRQVSALVVVLDIAAVIWIYYTARRRNRERVSNERRIQYLNRQLSEKLAEVHRLNEELESRVLQKTRELARTVAQLERSKAELERFAHIAAHDLQEPLRQVAGFNGLLALKYAGGLDAAGRGYIASSISGVKRLEAMMKGLLTYSLITPSSMTFARNRIEPLARAAIEDLRAEIEQAGAVVRLEVEQGCEQWTDGVTVRRVIRELVSNAVKFRHPQLPPAVNVAIWSDNTAAAWTIRVADNGIGIEEPLRNRAFDVFARLHPAGFYPGAGVGLAICKKIVGYHGGTLSVGPGEGGTGSSFLATLPCSIPDEFPVAATMKRSNHEQPAAAAQDSLGGG